MLYFFFFKHKTAYERRISDWSSDVCSSDLQTATHDRYGPVPFWDTGRNQIVLLELMEPEAVRNIMASELAMAREKGYMNTSFHGDNAVFLFLGAWERGIEFDYEAAYEYLRKNANDPQGPRGYLPE